MREGSAQAWAGLPLFPGDEEGEQESGKGLLEEGGALWDPVQGGEEPGPERKG